VAFDFLTWAGLVGVAFVAGLVDSIAGGGGLLTLPALLLAGLDPIVALGTNKVQASAASVSATIAFARRGLIDGRTAAPFVASAALASLIGAFCISLLPRSWLETLVPILLILFAFYFALSPRISEHGGDPRLSPRIFALTLIPLVGFYDGVFGPGAGTFYMMAFVTFLRFGIVRATGYTKAANAASNLGSLAFFAVRGGIVWPLGLAMACGAFLGAQIGARLAMRLGARLIRPLLVTVSSLMAARLLLRDGGLLHAFFAFGH
jgi:uncharacterized membrane protein YfcA